MQKYQTKFHVKITLVFLFLKTNYLIGGAQELLTSILYHLNQKKRQKILISFDLEIFCTTNNQRRVATFDLLVQILKDIINFTPNWCCMKC